MGGGCSNGCTVEAFAELDLACWPNDLTSVSASGSCSVPDAGLDDTTTVNRRAVIVRANQAGDCHVELTFASGFRFATDITFMTKNSGTAECPGCPDYYASVDPMRVVNNPPETCLPSDAGDADGGPDAG